MPQKVKCLPHNREAQEFKSPESVLGSQGSMVRVCNPNAPKGREKVQETLR